MINENEKRIYNLYLSVSRSSRNKPYSLRKNFDEFEKDTDYVPLKRVCNFFNKFPQIKPYLYFKAPFVVWGSVEYFPLVFFSSQKAIKSYTIYFKQLQEQSPDSNEQLEFIKESLKFIALFCIKNKIHLNDYPTFKQGSTFSWMKHVKEHNISIYPIFGFFGVLDIISSIPEDEKELLLSDIAENIVVYKTRFIQSKEAQQLIKDGMQCINKVIENDLNKKD